MITLCCIHVPGDREHNAMEERLVRSYVANPPGVDHKTILICQGGDADSEMLKSWSQLQCVTRFVRSGEGRDIGGYIDAAEAVDTDVMLCMGGNATVRRSGWMKRMEDAWLKHGPGFYGSLTSYQIRPHFNTSGFWLSPKLMMSYPHRVVTKDDRYEFEHGAGALWLRAHRQGLPTKLVTWDGEYDLPDWRIPPNISCRGDQSNCLTYFRVNYDFDHYCLHDPVSRNNLMYLTDAHILDPEFVHLREPLVNPKQP